MSFPSAKIRYHRKIIFGSSSNIVSGHFHQFYEFATKVVHTMRPWDKILTSWWRHQMETFSALLAICAGNSPVAGEFPAQRPVTRSFDAFFDHDLRLNKRLYKQSWGWWFETLSCPLWRHSNAGDDVLKLIFVFLEVHWNLLSTVQLAMNKHWFR